MITIDALGKDGASILPDLDGASPTGGYVTSESRDGMTLAPGDIVSHFGEWVAVAVVSHNGITGNSQFSYYAGERGGGLRDVSMWGGQSVTARTDCRIDPDTLYQLSRAQVPA